MGVRLIGITGGIGAGKSVVSRILRLRGRKVYDCDLQAKILMDRSESFLHTLEERYGREVVAEGIINRRALADIIFTIEEERLWLNREVHAMVREDLQRWREEMKFSQRDIFVESAILYESGLAEICDEIWIVEAPEEIRIARVLERSNMEATNENIIAIRNRMETQSKEIENLIHLPKPIKKILNDGQTSILQSL